MIFHGLLTFFSLVLMRHLYIVDSEVKEENMFGKNEMATIMGVLGEFNCRWQDANRIKAAELILEATKGGNDKPLRDLAIEELASQLGISKK